MLISSKEHPTICMKNKHIYLGITIMAQAMEKRRAFFTQLLAWFTMLVENRSNSVDATEHKTDLDGQADPCSHHSWCWDSSLLPNSCGKC